MSDRRRGLRDGIPIGLGYLSVSFAFGIQAVSLGLSPLQAVLISMTNLTSAGQLAGIGLMAGGASLVEMALAQITINMRYALMSLSLTQRLGADMTGFRRAFFAFGNTDEIFAVASGQKGELNHHYLYALMLAPYLGWSLGTLLGSLAGTLLPVFFRDVLGIAIYGMFLAIILPPARSRKSVAAVVLMAACLSLAFRYLPFLRNLSGGYAMIISAVVSAAAAALMFPVGEEDE